MTTVVMRAVLMRTMVMSSEDEQQYKDRSDDSDMESSDEYNQ